MQVIAQLHRKMLFWRNAYGILGVSCLAIYAVTATAEIDCGPCNKGCYETFIRVGGHSQCRLAAKGAKCYAMDDNIGLCLESQACHPTEAANGLTCQLVGGDQAKRSVDGLTSSCVNGMGDEFHPAIVAFAVNTQAFSTVARKRCVDPAGGGTEEPPPGGGGG